MLGPRQQRASAAVVSNAANNVSDASKAVGLIGETVDSSRQQELVFEALRVMMPEIRVNQFLSGKRLQMKKVAKDGDKNAVKEVVLLPKTLSVAFTSSLKSFLNVSGAFNALTTRLSTA